MSGMSPIGGSPESGCQLISACSVGTCDPTARCQTELNGEPRSDTQAFLSHYLQLGGGPKSRVQSKMRPEPEELAPFDFVGTKTRTPARKRSLSLHDESRITKLSQRISPVTEF